MIFKHVDEVLDFNKTYCAILDLADALYKSRNDVLPSFDYFYIDGGSVFVSEHGRNGCQIDFPIYYLTTDDPIGYDEQKRLERKKQELEEAEEEAKRKENLEYELYLELKRKYEK